jgi:hypothetical protein
MVTGKTDNGCDAQKRRFRIVYDLLLVVALLILVVMSVGSLLYCYRQDTLRTTIGNIEVHVKESGDSALSESQDVAQEIWLLKDKKPFLLLTQKGSGETTQLFLMREKDRPLLLLKSSDPNGGWNHATYSSMPLDGNSPGEIFHDIDYDGRFDFKLIRDADTVSRYIFLEGDWAEVTGYDTGVDRALIGNMSYVFQPDIGWRRE